MGKAFLKMHGLGNDFVIIDGRADNFKPDARLCRAIADRRWGIGCDQLIVLAPAKNPAASLFMHIYNLDGSEAEACGNATRCVARLLFEETKTTQAVIQTLAGLLKVERGMDDAITAQMGAPRLDWKDIPLAYKMDTLNADLSLGGLANPCCVNIGNPHAVFFVPDVDAIPLHEVGPQLETHALFPQRCNIEIAHILAPDKIRMRVWERGSGITQACGSAACATLVAAVRRGLSQRKATIVMDGGPLLLEWRDDNNLYLTGPTALAFRGELSDELAA